MKFSDNSERAASYLRQAIPKMVTHKIVPNPLNYTLWYSYFSAGFPQLITDLDQTIERYGTCPPLVGEELFVRHITQLGEGNQIDFENFQKAFSQTVNNISSSMDETALQSTGYTAALKDNLSALGDCDLDAAIAPVISDLSANATALCDVNETFQGQLTAAQSEINALKSQLDKSQREANTDPLTGLFNRRVFESIFNQFEDEHNQEDQLALIMMDIDKFKVFNDTYGHLKGDQILQFVGELLKSECPENVTAVRFGGEEFAILCPNYEITKAFDVAEKIRIKLASVSFSNKKTGTKIPPVTASFGISSKRSNEILKQIIERADKALYVAKDAGRNQVQMES
ncbi:MAG: diguanylate cyclase [Alphaproteobacteria bacterium]|jgi:diguanylate cyclase